MLRKFAGVLGLLLLAGSAFGQFEGVLQMKMTMAGMDGEKGGGGTMTVSVGKGGMRSEMDMHMGPMNMKMTMLQKADNPNIVYRINEASKSYTEIDQGKMMEMANKRQESRKYTVEKLGQEDILGYKTQHVLVKEQSPGGENAVQTEMWVAKDLLDYATFSKLQDQRNRHGEGMLKALKDAGADGMPLKSVATMGEGAKMTMEVVKVEKKSLPASTFEIPEGYTKSQGGMMDMLGGMSAPQGDEMRHKMDEAKKRMEEAMKNMTPEQREMLEKMMKQRPPGNQ